MAALIANNSKFYLDFGSGNVDFSPYVVSVDVAGDAGVLDTGTFGNPYWQAIGRPQYNLVVTFIWSEALLNLLSAYIDTDIDFTFLPDDNDHTLGDEVTLALSLHADDIIDTAAAHNLTAGMKVQFPTLTGGAGLTAGTQHYFVIADNLDADSFQVSLTLGGSAVDFTSNITAGTVKQVIPKALSGTVRFGALPFGTFKVGEKVETDIKFAIVSDLTKT
jgi:hypothetical protein